MLKYWEIFRNLIVEGHLRQEAAKKGVLQTRKIVIQYPLSVYPLTYAE